MSDELASAEVAGRVGHSTFWSTAASVGSQVIRFSVIVVLSHLVSPSQFGIVAIASVLIDVMSIVAVGGISEAVVRKKTLSDTDADTAFWTNLGAGLVFAALGAAASPLIAHLFKTPQLGPVLAALCLSFVIWPFGATHTARLSRELKFKALAIREIVANLAGAAAGIVLALQGYGVWALVARALVTLAVLVVMVWVAHPWRPKLRFRVQALRELSGFGTKFMGSQLVGQINGRGVELIAGLVIAPAAAGLLRIGGQSFSLLTQVSVAPVAAVAMPLLSRTQDDPAAGREVFGRISQLSALMIYPVFFGTMAISDLIFPLMFGKSWALTGAVMPVLCAIAIPLQVNMLLSAGLASRGKAATLLRWTLLQTAVGIPLTLTGAFFGLFPLLGFTVARNYLLLPVGLMLLKRNTELSPGLLIAKSVGPLLCALAMAGVVFGAKLLLGGTLGPVAQLALLIPLGIAVYAGLVAATHPDLRERARDFLRQRRLRRA